MAETVGAILIDNSTVLLGLRAAHKAFAGCWDIIGGHIEPGETECSALRRELSEEVGIECVEGRYHAALTLFDSDRRSSILHIYLVWSWRGEPVLRNDEHTAIRWFALEEAACLSNLASPQYRSIFASLHQPLLQ